VSSFSGYGALSRVKDRELRVGSALAGKPQGHDADEKEDGSDFALWKAHKPDDGDNFWPSPWGQGRPGWHIECSAMSKKHLGETIDLHTGGVDLLFPHHENEIAQSQCCNDGAIFAHHWYHSEHLLVDGKKMSKSLGNLYTLDQLREMGHSPAALRYALLAGHPRKQLNFTLDSLHAAEKALAQLRAFRATLQAGGTADPFAPALAALADDLNTPQALGIVFTALHAGPEGVSPAAFDRLVFALGLDLTEPAKPVTATPPEVTAIAEQRWAAKAAKNWPEADRLRGALSALGWTMLDRKDGYSLEPAKK
jgi:cysteinyl-tRNA synthetase